MRFRYSSTREINEAYEFLKLNQKTTQSILEKQKKLGIKGKKIQGRSQTLQTLERGNEDDQIATITVSEENNNGKTRIQATK